MYLLVIILHICYFIFTYINILFLMIFYVLRFPLGRAIGGGVADTVGQADRQTPVTI